MQLLENKNLKIIKGGFERSDSSLLALKYIKKFKPKNILIHDAARPNFSIKLIKRIIQKLKNNKAVIPATSPTESVKYESIIDLYYLNHFWNFTIHFNNLTSKKSTNSKKQIENQPGLKFC